MPNEIPDGETDRLLLLIYKRLDWVCIWLFMIMMNTCGVASAIRSLGDK